ncbi:MAG: ABC transporter substrate-binding protein, partial [Proteobacteria bacterium]|nr:ABC transporter substrate-binding protein [Pseudomonadota bacterium]
MKNDASKRCAAGSDLTAAGNAPYFPWQMEWSRLSLRHAATRFVRPYLCVIVSMAGALAAAVPAQAAVQGVTGEEIVVGTHLDLSGPLSTWGTALRNGMRMAFDEANEAGGIGGRNLRLVAADDTYDPDMALKAVRMLHEENRVFAILSPMGTPTVLAAMPYVLENQILYL